MISLLALIGLRGAGQFGPALETARPRWNISPLGRQAGTGAAHVFQAEARP